MMKRLNSTKKTMEVFENNRPKVRNAKGSLRKFVAKTKRGWTEAEEADLKAWVKDHSDEAVKDLLNAKYGTDRTYTSIVNKRQSLGIEKFARQQGRKRTVSNTPAEERLPTGLKQTVIAKTQHKTTPLVRHTKESVTVRLDGTGFSDILNSLLAAQRQGIEVKVL